MAQIISKRSSGRDITLVRRAPLRRRPPVLEPADLNKADLANLAAAEGLDTSGTKAELLAEVEAEDG